MSGKPMNFDSMQHIAYLLTEARFKDLSNPSYKYVPARAFNKE
jgi:hypothetical protein